LTSTNWIYKRKSMKTYHTAYYTKLEIVTVYHKVVSNQVG